MTVLRALRDLDLRDNRILELPDGLFPNHTVSRRTSVDPLPSEEGTT